MTQRIQTSCCAGDLISLMVPDGGQQVFEFEPLPTSEAGTYNGSLSSTLYVPHFVAIDGSGASLSLVTDYNIQSPSQPSITLSYDSLHNEYVVVNDTLGTSYVDNGNDGGSPILQNSALDIGFNPARPQLAVAYQVTESDGAAYIVNAATGEIESLTDKNGNTITYATNGNTITATDQSGQTVLTINTNSDNEITSIQVPGQGSIDYAYDNGSHNLIEMQTPTGNTTLYSYQDVSNSHYLTAVTNASGIAVLQAQYDDSTGELSALVNAEGVIVPVSSVGLGGNEAMQVVVDAAGDITQDVFEEQYGTLLRKIQVVTEGSGGSATVSDYIVTLANVSYVTDDLSQMSDLYPSGVELPQTADSYAPFEIADSDAAGVRFTQQPDANSWTTQTVFDTSDDPDVAAAGQILSLSQRLTDGGSLQTTVDANYAIVNTTLDTAKPQLVTVEIQTADSDSPTGYDNEVQSMTYSSYDSSGDLVSSYVVLARIQAPPMNQATMSTRMLATGHIRVFWRWHLTD